MNKNIKYPEWGEIKHEYYTPDELLLENIYMKLIKEILLARKNRNISQRRLAELSGVKQQLISRIESGVSNPNITTVIKLLNALGKQLAIEDITIKQEKTEEEYSYSMLAQG